MRLRFPESQEENVAYAGIASEKLGIVFEPPFLTAVALDSAGQIGGVLVFNDYNGANITISAAGERAWSPSIVRGVCQYVFHNLGCVRITARTRRSNHKVRKLLKKHATEEAMLKNWFGDEDAFQFRMLRDECPWLEKKHGLDFISAAA